MSAEPGDVSQLLRAWGKGDAQAGEDWCRSCIASARRAAAYLRNERPDHTLQPTALVHEAYVRLVGQDRVSWQNRVQFFGVAAQMMRRILVDHARRHHAAKRPGAGAKVTLDDHIGAAQPYDCEILLLDQALGELARIYPRQVEIVEIRRRFFAPNAPTDHRTYCDFPLAVTGQITSTRSLRTPYMMSYSFTAGSQCGTINSSLSPTLYCLFALSYWIDPNSSEPAV